MSEVENGGMEYISPHGNGSKIASNPRDCPLWNSCSANLCPLDPEIKNNVWSPEEKEYNEICRNKEFQNLRFIITQKKIARAVRKDTEDREDYFTFDMLNRNIMVKKGIRGITEPPDTTKNPVRWYREHERKWIEEHPEISEEKMRNLKERGKTLAKLKQKVAPDNTFSEIVSPRGIITIPEPSSPLKAKDGGIFNSNNGERRDEVKRISITAFVGGSLND